MTSPSKSAPLAIPRRRFLGAGLAAVTPALHPRSVLGGPARVGPNGKTTVAFIGMGGQGLVNLHNFLEFDEVRVVAVCDVNREGGGYISWNWSNGKEQKTVGREPARRMVDAHYAGKPGGGSGGCRAYADYRELLTKEDVDAVVISTPDHTHAVIAMAALRMKKHVYCEKPLAWSVREARTIAEEARRAGVATQLGNHGQASEVDRVVREMIADGAIGPVRELQLSIPPRFWHYPEMQGRPQDTPPVPDGLDWDLWLGPAPERPYHPEYHPWTWRNWWDFGTGQLGDLGCHQLSTPFKALGLTHPLSVEASSTKLFPDVYPLGVIAHFDFPARGDHPPLRLSWHDGGLQPPLPREIGPRERRGHETTYIGDDGVIFGNRIMPREKAKAYGRPPKTLERSPGHYREFVSACRGGPAPGANFPDHAGVLTETVLLGNVAVRAGKKLHWDGPGLKITNDESANQLLQREYRDGWTL